MSSVSRCVGCNYEWDSEDTTPFACPRCGQTCIETEFSKNPLDVQVGGGHYKKYAIQPAEYNQRNGLGYIEGNVVKYITRHKDKNGVEDIDKAIHYLELLKEITYGDSSDK